VFFVWKGQVFYLQKLEFSEDLVVKRVQKSPYNRIYGSHVVHRGRLVAIGQIVKTLKVYGDRQSIGSDYRLEKRERKRRGL